MHVSSFRRVLTRISGNLVIAIPIAMVLGFVAGSTFDLSSWKAAVLPFTMLMVYPMLVNFQLGEVRDMRDSKAVILALVLDFVVLPLVAFGLAKLFFADSPGLFVGMVLAGLFPTSGMTISWTGFAKGNIAAAVKMTVIGLIAASLLAPAYLYLFAGAVVPVDVGEITRTVLLVVGVPMIAGQLTRVVLLKRMGKRAFKTEAAPVLSGVSSVGVLAIVFLAIALKAPMIASRPGLLLTIAAPLAIFYAVNFAISTWLGRRLLPRGDAIALVYGTVMRNLSIALGIAIASFGPEAALLLAGAYIVQVQGAAWYVRATDKIFGPVPTIATEPAAAA